MIVLDASVIIAHFSRDDPHAARAFAVLDTDDDLTVHPLTLAEILVRPARDGREQAVLDGLDRLGIVALQTPPDEPVHLARLRARTGLRVPDACVLVAAHRERAALATFDARLSSVAADVGVVVVDGTGVGGG